MKNIYILKKINEIRLEKFYADNRLKRFKTRNIENLSTKQIKIRKILNITFENSINTVKKSYIINRNIQINDKTRNETARNTVESLNANDQIFENVITNDNLLNLKI